MRLTSVQDPLDVHSASPFGSAIHQQSFRFAAIAQHLTVSVIPRRPTFAISRTTRNRVSVVGSLPSPWPFSASLSQCFSRLQNPGTRLLAGADAEVCCCAVQACATQAANPSLLLSRFLPAKEKVRTSLPFGALIPCPSRLFVSSARLALFLFGAGDPCPARGALALSLLALWRFPVPCQPAALRQLRARIHNASTSIRIRRLTSHRKGTWYYGTYRGRPAHFQFPKSQGSIQPITPVASRARVVHPPPHPQNRKSHPHLALHSRHCRLVLAFIRYSHDSSVSVPSVVGSFILIFLAFPTLLPADRLCAFHLCFLLLFLPFLPDICRGPFPSIPSLTIAF